MTETRLHRQLRLARGMAAFLGVLRVLLVAAGSLFVAGVAQGGVGMIFSEIPLLIQASWIVWGTAGVFVVTREIRALLPLTRLAAVSEKLGCRPPDQFLTASELLNLTGSDVFRSRAIAQTSAAFPKDWIVRLARGGKWPRALLFAATGPLLFVWMVWKIPSPDFRWALWPFRSALQGLVSVQPGNALYPRGDDVLVTVHVLAKDIAEPRLEVRIPGLGWESRALLPMSPGAYTLNQNPQSSAKTETEKTGFFTSNKVQALAGTTDKLFRGGRSESSIESRDPTGDFGLILRSLNDSLDYRVVYQNRRGPRFRLTPFDPPKLIHVGVRIDPPPYTGKKPEIDSDLLSVKVLAGSRVRWSLRTDPPESILRSESERNFSPLEKKGVEWSWTVTVDHSMKQSLWARRSKDWAEAHLVDLSMEAVPDELPTVSLLEPTEDLQVDLKGGLPVTAEMSDDVGLSDLSLFWRVGTDQWTRTLWKKYPMGVVADLTENEMNVAQFPVKAGDRIAFFLAVRDRCPSPHEGRSEVRQIEVVDDKANHDRIVDDAEALQKSLLDRLAEERGLRQEVSISTPNWGGLLTGQRQVARRLSDDAEHLNELVDRMAQDPGTDQDTLLDFKGLAESFKDLNQEMMPESDRSLLAQDQPRAESALGRGIDELERMTRLSARTLREQRMRQIMRDQSDLSNLAENTARSLSAKSALSEEEVRKFEETVQGLREMADRIRDQIEKMQATFTENEINKARVEILRFDRVSKSLSRLSQALQDNNGAEALAAANDALEQLREIERQIREASHGSSGAASEMMDVLSEEQQRLGRLLQRQESLLYRTLNVVSKRNVLSAAEWETVYPWATEQEELAGETQSLSEKIAAISSDTARLSTRCAVHLTSAAALMWDAAQTLRFRAVQQTQEKQEQALELLRETQEKLNDALEHPPLPDRTGVAQGRSARRRKAGANAAGTSDNVKMPDVNEFHPPMDFRKELMDSMKESYPPDQEGAVQNYFRHWTK